MKTHREIAEQLDLFHSEPQAPGMIFGTRMAGRYSEIFKST